MVQHVVVLNAGSSSLKFGMYRLSERGSLSLVAQGQVEGIGTQPRFSAKDAAGATLDEQNLSADVSDASGALDQLAQWLASRFDRESLVAVGHRVVHGGEKYARATRVTPEIVRELEKLSPLAPLHQPFNLAAINAVFDRMPGLPQVACFDTAFHRGHSAVAELIPLPRDICGRGLQRYGFHGLSYEYIASVLTQVAPEIATGRVLVAHLGSGASICALQDGRSVDSTLGFTALDGLCMGSRPGGIDPGVVLYLIQQLGLSASEVEDILYRKSGLLGISGISNDMRALLGNDEPSARLAVDYFVYRAAKEIGALTAALGGLDGLVFTAGIGENSAEIRRRICEASSWLGVHVDTEANDAQGPRITTRDSEVSAWVIPTDEELMIARHTVAQLDVN
ncbi:MAG: acetate/propionate family kinase [Woeseiaceae bacterium]